VNKLPRVVMSSDRARSHTNSQEIASTMYDVSHLTTFDLAA